MTMEKRGIAAIDSDHYSRLHEVIDECLEEGAADTDDLVLIRSLLIAGVDAGTKTVESWGDRCGITGVDA